MHPCDAHQRCMFTLMRSRAPVSRSTRNRWKGVKSICTVADMHTSERHSNRSRGRGDCECELRATVVCAVRAEGRRESRHQCGIQWRLQLEMLKHE
jgi:hypothetical protein